MLTSSDDNWKSLGVSESGFSRLLNHDVEIVTGRFGKGMKESFPGNFHKSCNQGITQYEWHC